MKNSVNLVKWLTDEKDRGIFIWICNIGAEKFWNKVNAGMTDKAEQFIINRIEDMNLLICRKQDYIILQEKPNQHYLNTLESYGFTLPTILYPENPDPVLPISENILKDLKLQNQLREIAKNNNEVYLVPYGVTNLEEKISEICGLKLLGPTSKASAMINDKVLSREIAEKLDFPICEGKVCRSIDEIREEYFRLIGNELGFKRVIVKEPYGTSGKGLYVIDDKAKLELVLKIIGRFSKNDPNARWLVEGWYNKNYDISYQIFISDDGTAQAFSMKRQLLNDTVFNGSRIPLDVDKDVLSKFVNDGEKIGRHLFSLGYTGMAGVDSIITTKDEIIPIIEINGRFSMSSYTSFLKKIIGDNLAISRYLRISTTVKKDYKNMCDLLETEGILFNTEKKEGVIIFTAGTLPYREIPGTNGFQGRLYVLVVGNDDEKLNLLNNKLEQIINNL